MKTHSRFQGSVRLLVLLGLLISWLATSGAVQAQQAIRIIWLHHSCGQNLIDQGGVREGLASLGYEFYDHGYNDEGLRLANGEYAGYNYDIPGDNTDPDGLAELFGQPLHDPPDNAFSLLMQYDVIAFKSCFPTSNISSDEQLADFQAYYRAIRDRIAQHPDKLFITVTQPPQVPGASEPDEAARARMLANWLKSSDYLAGLSNLETFDFFGYLAGDDNFLQARYRMDNYDAHPNERANQEIGPQFVDFVDRAIRSHNISPGAAPPAAPSRSELATTPEAAAQETIPAQPEPSAREVAAPVAGGTVVEDFESGGPGWHASYDEIGSTVACTMDTSAAHGGTASLRVEYNFVRDGSGGCFISLESLPNWSAGAGLSLWMRSDRAGQPLSLVVFAGNPMGATAFETFFETTAAMTGAWTQLTLPWSDLQRAEWAEGGLPTMDPALMVGYGFALSQAEGGSTGVLWIDDIQLASGGPGAAQPAQPIAPTEPASRAQPTAEPAGRAQPTATPGAQASASATLAAQGKKGGGLCPASVLLPLGAMGVVMLRRRR